MPAHRVIRCQEWVVEILGRIATHAQALHQAPGAAVGRRGEGHHLGRRSRSKAKSGGFRFAGESTAPVGGRQAPADLTVGAKCTSMVTSNRPVNPMNAASPGAPEPRARSHARQNAPGRDRPRRRSARGRAHWGRTPLPAGRRTSRRTPAVAVAPGAQQRGPCSSEMAEGEGSRSWEAFSETADSSAKPVLARQPVQHMMPQAVAGGRSGCSKSSVGSRCIPRRSISPREFSLAGTVKATT